MTIKSVLSLAATCALLLLIVGCGGTAHRASAAQRCADRWNSNLKRNGGALGKVPNISSYSAHVGTVKGSCVVVVLKGNNSIVFATRGPKPSQSGSDYLYVESGNRHVRASLRVPNARFDSDLKITLK